MRVYRSESSLLGVYLYNSYSLLIYSLKKMVVMIFFVGGSKVQGYVSRFFDNRAMIKCL